MKHKFKLTRLWVASLLLLFGFTQQMWAYDLTSGNLYFDKKPLSGWGDIYVHIYKNDGNVNQYNKLSTVSGTDYWVYNSDWSGYTGLELYGSTHGCTDYNKSAWYTQDFKSPICVTLDGSTWKLTAVGVKDVTLSDNGSTTYGGNGTSSTPYIIWPGDDIKATMSCTKIASDNHTRQYKFNSDSFSSTDTYQETTSTTSGTAYTISGKARAVLSNNTSTTSREFSATSLYYKTATFYLIKSDGTNKGTKVGSMTRDGSGNYTYDWTCSTPGTYYFYVSTNQSSGKGYDFLGEATFADGTAHECWLYGTSNYAHVAKLVTTYAGTYTFTFYKDSESKYQFKCDYPAAYSGLSAIRTPEAAADAPEISSNIVAQGSSVTVTAKSPKTGYKFDGWTSNNGSFGTTTNLSTTFTPKADNAVATANYSLINYTITYDPETPVNFAYTAAPTSKTYGQLVEMTFTPATNYVIAGVTVYKTGDESTKVAVNNPSTNNYNFTQPAYNVTVEVSVSLSQVTVTYGTNGSGQIIGKVGGTSIGTSPTKVNGGSTIEFTATPSTGYKVIGFYSDEECTDANKLQSSAVAEGSSDTYTINNISDDASVYAKFDYIDYTITMAVSPSGKGTITPPSVTQAHINVPFTISASNATGYTFNNWTSTDNITITTGESTTATLTDVTGDKTITANFTEDMHSVAVVSEDPSKGTVSTASVSNIGIDTKSGEITATPNPGYYFTGWTIPEGVTIAEGTDKNATIKINATADDITITANFAERFYLRGSSTDNQETKKGMPGWKGEEKTEGLFTAINGNTATITRTLEASTTYKLKLGDLADGSSWGGSSAQELTNGVEWQFTSHDNTCSAPTFRSSVAGSYIFTIDFSETNPKMKIDYPDVPDYDLTVTKLRVYGETTLNNFISGDGTENNPYKFYLDEKMHLAITALSAVTGVTAYYKFGDDAESSTVLTKDITAASTTKQSIVVKTYYKGNIGSYTSAEKTETIYYQGVAVPALHLSASWNEKEESELSETPQVTIYYSADNYSGEATVTSSKDGATPTDFMTITDKSQDEKIYQMEDKTPHRYDFAASASVNERDFKATTSVSIYRLVEVRIKDTQHLMTKYYMWINGPDPIQYEKAWPGNDFIGKLGDWHIFLVKYPSYTHFVLNNGMNWGDQGAEQTEDVALPDHNTCYEIGTKDATSHKYNVNTGVTCPDILYVGGIDNVTLAQGESQLIAPEVDLDYGYDESQLQISFPDLPTGFTAVQQGKGFLLTGTTQGSAKTINVTYTLNEYSVNKSFQATVTHPSSILIQVKVPYGYSWDTKDFVKVHCFNHGISKDIQTTYRGADGTHDTYYANLPLGTDGKVDFQVYYANLDKTWTHTKEVNNVDKPGCYTIGLDDGTYGRSVERNDDYCWAEYQVKINMASGEEYESNAVEDLSKIVSFYAPGKNETGNKSGLVRIMRNGTQVAVVSADKFDKSGVYTAKIVDNGTVSLTEVALYTGDYYIRTDGVNPDNKTDAWDITKYVKERTMTNFSLYDGAKYNYYWTKNVKKTSLNVKARVANQYNDNLAVMLVESSYTDNDGNIRGTIDATGVNLRFGYNPETNYLERAILRGSTAASNYFLNIQGDNVFNDAACETQELNETNYGSHPAYSVFNDVSDWVYEKLIYVKIDGSHPSASILLKSKDFSNNVMYQLGSKEGTPVQRVVMGQGTSQGTYSLRVIYDYKTNRLSATWEPSGVIDTEKKVDADILFVSNEGNDVKQVTFGDNANAKLTSLQSIMYVLELKNDYIPTTDAPDAQYWIALPFECKISDIFGIENYISLDENRIAHSGWWGIMRYRGDLRAEKGWFKEDTPEGFWEWMYPNESLEPGQGYVLYVEKKSLKWEAIKVEEPCTDGEGCQGGKKVVEKKVKRFYFPSLVEGFTMNKTLSGEASQVVYENQTCSKKGREAYDSNWKVIAPKSYDNIQVTSADEYSTTGQTTWPNFIYQYNPSNKTYTPVDGVGTVGEPFVYHSFHGYMAQYAGTITWQQYSKTEHKTPRFAEESEFKGGTMTIELVQNNEQLDRTFVQLNKFGTEGFDQNLDLTKITENCAQIASVSEDVLYAGNTLPLDIELVPLNVKVVANGTYDIALEQSLEGLEVRLYDAFEQTTTPLDLMSATVTLDKGEYKDRFFLQFVQKSPLTPTNFNGAIEQFNLPTDKTQKLLINDNIYLINGGRIYNVLGARP